MGACGHDSLVLYERYDRPVQRGNTQIQVPCNEDEVSHMHDTYLCGDGKADSTFFPAGDNGVYLSGVRAFSR